MKLRSVILLLCVMHFHVPSNAQIPYLLRLITKGDKEVVVISRRAESMTYQEFKRVADPDVHSRLKKAGTRGVALQLSESMFQHMTSPGTLSAEAKRLIEESSSGVVYNKDNKAADQLFANRSSLKYQQAFRKPPVAVKAKTKKYSQIDNVDVFVSIPADMSEYKKVFGSNNSSVASITALSKELSAAGSNFKFPKSGDALFEGFRSRQGSKPVIIIGHNENGFLKFPDGSSLEFKEIDEATTYKDFFPLIYLSCNANKFTSASAVGFKLSYEDALDLAARISTKLSGKEPDREAIRQIFTQSVNEFISDKKQNLKVKVALMSITTGAGVTYYLYEAGKD